MTILMSVAFGKNKVYACQCLGKRADRPIKLNRCFLLQIRHNLLLKERGCQVFSSFKSELIAIYES
jgi:hypothetical protein